MPRALLLCFGLLVVAGAALLAAGCLDSMAATPRQNLPDASSVVTLQPAGAMHPLHVSSTVVAEKPDAGESPDLLTPAPPDLRPTDLTGLTDCYDRAYCDSATMFCLRYFAGSPGKPGGEKLAPSCYAPNDPCPNGTLDCNCIQQDAVLGSACAECFDNKDGTFTCYAQ